MPAAPYPAPVTVVRSQESHSSPIAALLGVLAVIFFVILMVVAISDNSSDEAPQPEPTAAPEPTASG
ncbi:MAG: hypothetical protein ACR2OH_15230 [Microthrixaceae bacterium]